MTDEIRTQARTLKRYLVHPRFQLKFIGWMLAIAALCLVLIYCSNLIFLNKLVLIGNNLQLPANHPFFQFISEQEKILLRVFAWTAVGVVMITVGGGLLLSHRIAGPIDRIERHIDGVLSKNKIKEMRFRKKDFFPELAVQVNLLIRRIERNLKN
jgi:hypothetical protein